jgi:hypothetical protein
MACSRPIDNTNADAVLDGPVQPTVFGLAQSTLVTRVALYFFFGGAGADPQSTTVQLLNTGTNAFAGVNGRFGPSPLSSAPDRRCSERQREVFPNTVQPPGRYVIQPDDRAIPRWPPVKGAGLREGRG